MKNGTQTEATNTPATDGGEFSTEFLNRIRDTLGSLAELSLSMSQEPDRDRRVAMIREMSIAVAPLWDDTQRLIAADDSTGDTQGSGPPDDFVAHFTEMVHNTIGKLVLLDCSLSQATDAENRLSIIRRMNEAAEPLPGTIYRLLISEEDPGDDSEEGEPQDSTEDAERDDDDDAPYPVEWLIEKVERLTELVRSIHQASDDEQRHAAWRKMHRTAADLAILMEQDCGCGHTLCEPEHDPDCPFQKLAEELFGKDEAR